MQIITVPEFIDDCLDSLRDNLPKTIACVKCKKSCHPILIVDDDEAWVAQNAPQKLNGFPVHPHTAAIFVLYMCDVCGEITTVWTQAI